MSFQTESQKNESQEVKIPEQSALLTETVLETNKLKHSTYAAFFSTALSTLLGLVASAVTFSSYISSVRIKWNYAWYIGGILGFQIILFYLISIIRKRNRHIFKLKQQLIEFYLSALNKSSLNPSLKSE